MRTRNVKPFVLLLLSFALPVFVYLIVMVAARVVPFGDNTLLIWDANDTYAATLTYWRDVLLGQQSYPYSFNGMLGINLVEAFATGLSSPLNAILVLFPRGAMPLAFSTLTLLKIGLCGLTFMIYLRKRYQCGLAGVLFSASYALMSFVAVYFMHTIWLEALILLPLAALGVYRIADGGNPLLFIISFALTIYCQFYMAYMVGLFSALYFVYLLIIGGGEAKTTAKSLLRKVFSFAGAALLSVGLAAAGLLPVVYHTITLGNQMDVDAIFSAGRVSTTFGILAKAYTAAISAVQERSGPPNYYICIPLLAFALLYFTNRYIQRRHRIAERGLNAVFMRSFMLPALYLAWHLFNQPNFYPHRFSFLFSFVLLDLAWLGYQKIPNLSARGMKARAVILAGSF
ncbi:MAG: YfhO family protein, partial [Bacillota bacterium]